MSLKWKTAFLLFITSLVIIPVSIEYLLRVQFENTTAPEIVSESAVETSAQLLILSNGNWLIALIAILLLTIIGYIIGNGLAVKVDELIVGISKAGGGNYSQRILSSGSGSDEMTQLTVSYNRMLDNMLLASQEMKEQLQNYKSILDTAAEGMISLNDRGVIQEFNQSAMRIFGYQPEEIIGNDIKKLIPAEVEGANGETIEQSFMGIDDHNSIFREVIGIRKDGSEFPIQLSISISTINNSQIFTCIIRDISERKKRDVKQKNLEMQLRSLQRQQTVESLTGGIAHDFNNILGPVLGYADMALTDAEEGTRQHKYLTNILKGAHKARELVARIMSFTRQYEQSREQIHLSKVINDSLELLKSSIPSEHQIETFINTNNDLVAVDKTQLTQVLVTMVTNASQAMAENPGALTIRLDNITVNEELLAKSSRLQLGEYVRMRIQDTGYGMDALTLERVFEPFFTTRENADGSGLGLSVANGIIGKFNGDILVESVVNKGTTFSVFLPRIEDRSLAENNLSISKPMSEKGELILYIDDDPMIVELGKEMLESLGYEVEGSVSCEKAIQMFKDDPEDYDLIITDQSMPKMKGTTLARKFKEIREDIPIILVTGFSASILNKELNDSGIEHCISKPVVIDELGEIVLQALTKVNT